MPESETVEPKYRTVVVKKGGKKRYFHVAVVKKTSRQAVTGPVRKEKDNG